MTRDRRLMPYVSFPSAFILHCLPSKFCERSSLHMAQRIKILGLLLLVAASAYPFAALADEGQEAEFEHREAVRSAVEHGHIKPLSELLKEIQKHLPGKVLGVEIEQKGTQWIYEFRVIDTSGRLYEVAVDAATAEILKIEQE
jgi:uncharacterized membrane protein YkoI